MTALSETGRRHATQQAQDLLDKGFLDEPWAEAFAHTPRHLFLPSFYSQIGDSWKIITPDTVGEQRWLQLVYLDVTWVQRLHGPDSAPGTPASSCIQPSLAAQMLTALAIGPGARVCEVGLGTGWLTALLSHRCGSENVIGVELDPELIHQAHISLIRLSHHPTLICADGYNARPESAPYDGILSTAEVTHLPEPWLAQTKPDSRIVTPLRGAIAVIEIRHQGQATGRFLPEPIHILPLRTPRDHAHMLPARTGASAARTTSMITSLRDPRFRFVVGLSDPTIKIADLGLLGDLLLADDRGSSAQVSAFGHVDAQGTRDLWAAVSHIQEWWEHSGRPGPADFLIEVDQSLQWATLPRAQPERRWRIR